MDGAITQLPQYAFKAWYSVKKVQGQLYIYLYSTSSISIGRVRISGRIRQA
jgi:hypothetical protein